MERGLPRRALRMTVVIDDIGEAHAVLMVRTDRGDLILDNKTNAVLSAPNTGYTYIKREGQDGLPGSPWKAAPRRWPPPTGEADGGGPRIGGRSGEGCCPGACPGSLDRAKGYRGVPMRTVTIGVSSTEEASARALAAFRGEAQANSSHFLTVERLLWTVLTPGRWALIRALAGQAPCLCGGRQIAGPRRQEHAADVHARC